MVLSRRKSFFSDGAVEKEGNGFKIIVSPFQDEKRERFTIAHELGHLFLHMGYRTNNELWEKQENNIYHRIGNSEKEYQANEFDGSFFNAGDRISCCIKQSGRGKYG